MKALIRNISWEDNSTGAEHRLTIAKIVLEQVLDLCWQLKLTKQTPPWQTPPQTEGTNRQRVSLVGALLGVIKSVKIIPTSAKTTPECDWHRADAQNYEKMNTDYDTRLWMIIPHIKSNKHSAHSKQSISDGIVISKVWILEIVSGICRLYT